MCKNKKFHLEHDSSKDRRVKNAIPYIVRFPDKTCKNDPIDYLGNLETYSKNTAKTHLFHLS